MKRIQIKITKIDQRKRILLADEMNPRCNGNQLHKDPRENFSYFISSVHEAGNLYDWLHQLKRQKPVTGSEIEPEHLINCKCRNINAFGFLKKDLSLQTNFWSDKSKEVNIDHRLPILNFSDFIPRAPPIFF